MAKELKDQYTREEFEAAIAEKEAALNARVSKTDEKFVTMQDELKQLRDFQKKAEKEKADREQALAEAQRRAEEEKLSAQELIEKRTAELQGQYETLRQENERQQALFAKEREYTALQMYVQQAVAAAADEIEPRLLDYIGGTTREEVDMSIERAKQKTAEMFADIQAANTQARAAQPGVRPGPPPITPMDNPQSDGQLSPEQIAGMPWDEYAKFRQGRIPTSGQGLFG